MIVPWGLALLALIVVAVFLVAFSRYLSLWLQAYLTGARIGLLPLMLMSLRKVNPAVIVQCKVMAVQAGLAHISAEAIEAQYLAGGDVRRVTLALIAAHRAGIELDWNTAAAIDLAGRDIMEAVRVSVNPKVINCPDPRSGGGDTLNAIARDGIQLRVRVRVTVRTNMSALVGGATEATVIARVGQGIITAIGSCDTYRQALGDPLVITRQVISKSLDSQTAFAIVSIDIADIDVGENIGAKLQIDRADADIRIANAKAENRRAMAVAHLAEMKAEVVANRVKVVMAEAAIPAAIAEAFRAGQIFTRQSVARVRRQPTGSTIDRIIQAAAPPLPDPDEGTST